MDVTFTAAVRCTAPVNLDRGVYGPSTCGKEEEYMDLARDLTETADQFAARAAVEFEKKGWSVVPKKCRCPAHA